jgi:ribosomal protein S18 acetylase RimI-like enzyme
VIIRQATPADVVAIVRTFHAARAEATPWLPILHTEDEDTAHFGGHVRESDVRVAVVDGKVVAFVVIQARLLCFLYVAPEAQRGGVGTALLEEAMRAQPGGFTLWTHQGNERARRFYEKHGLRAIEFTDGSTNEERLPDVRYEWRPASS